MAPRLGSEGKGACARRGTRAMAWLSDSGISIAK